MSGGGSRTTGSDHITQGLHAGTKCDHLGIMNGLTKCLVVTVRMMMMMVVVVVVVVVMVVVGVVVMEVAVNNSVERNQWR